MPLVYPERFKKAILEHPDLPLVFFCEPEIWANQLERMFLRRYYEHANELQKYPS